MQNAVNAQLAYCIVDPSSMQTYGSFGTKSSNYVNIVAQWCGKSATPSPSCVPKEFADQYKNMNMEFRWAQRKKYYSPVDFGDDMIQTVIDARVIKIGPESSQILYYL